MTTPHPRASTASAAVAALAALPPEDLVAFLRAQRWFADKGGAATTMAARVSGVVPLPWGDGALAIARVAVTADDTERVYQLPVAARAVARENLPAATVIAAMTIDGRALVLFDAIGDPEFLRGLASAIATNCVVEGEDGLRWVVESESAQRLVLPANADIRVGSAEQSNTSIIFGTAAILKLFRRLEPGIHPDVEMSQFLTTRAGFAHTPTVLATLRFEEHPARHNGGDASDSRTIAGIVQEFLPGAADAWSYALERGKAYFLAPLNATPKNEFAADATRLGRITREMHDALASDDDDPAFAPDDATPEDLDRWAHRTQQMIRDSLALLDRSLGASATSPEARVLVQRRDRYLAWVNELADALGDDLGARTRIHGDYHLGQVLRTASGDFVVIDFEGEPTRSLDERCEKTSPLRDVAGMLRSFAYAAATMATSIEKTADLATRELRTARWERDVRAAFLAGYLDDDDASQGVLPDDETHVRQLISLFETEKAFYELAYELNHRPSWAWIPMRGISKLLVG